MPPEGMPGEPVPTNAPAEGAAPAENQPATQLEPTTASPHGTEGTAPRVAVSRIEQVLEALGRAHNHTTTQNELLNSVHEQLNTELPAPLREAVVKLGEVMELIGTFITNAETVRPPIQEAHRNAVQAFGITSHVFEGKSSTSDAIKDVVQPLQGIVGRNAGKAIGQPIRRARAANRRVARTMSYLEEQVLTLLPQGALGEENSHDVGTAVRTNIADGMVAAGGIAEYMRLLGR